VAVLIGGTLLLLQPFPAAAGEEAGEAPANGSAASGRPVADLIREADDAFAAEDYARARGLYEEAIRRGADAVRPLRRLALLQSWDGDLEDSLRNYRRAQELAPGDLDIALEIGKVLSWSNDLREAVLCYEDLRSKYPDDPRVLLGLAQALGWKGSYADADAIYRGMEERRIEPIQAHVGRAHLLAWQGDLHRAADFYRDVLRADPATWTRDSAWPRSTIGTASIDRPGPRPTTWSSTIPRAARRGSCSGRSGCPCGPAATWTATV